MIERQEQAILFFKTHGANAVEKVITRAPEGATDFLYDAEFCTADYLKNVPEESKNSFDLWKGNTWMPFLRHKKRISLTDVKGLLESHEVVARLGGLTPAKSTLKRYGRKPPRAIVEAVADVEACL